MKKIAYIGLRDTKRKIDRPLEAAITPFKGNRNARAAWLDIAADMVELVDTLGLGPRGCKPCGFKSCCPYLDDIPAWFNSAGIIVVLQRHSPTKQTTSDQRSAIS